MVLHGEGMEALVEGVANSVSMQRLTVIRVCFMLKVFISCRFIFLHFSPYKKINTIFFQYVIFLAYNTHAKIWHSAKSAQQQSRRLVRRVNKRLTLLVRRRLTWV